MQIKNQIIYLFLRKWRNSIHLDKIGKLVLSKTTIFKTNSKIRLTSLHLVIHPYPTHLVPPPHQKWPSCAPGNQYTKKCTSGDTLLPPTVGYKKIKINKNK